MRGPRQSGAPVTSLHDLDFCLHPTTVSRNALVQFVAVYQAKNAPTYTDTPTCIAWRTIDALGHGSFHLAGFEPDKQLRPPICNFRQSKLIGLSGSSGLRLAGLARLTGFLVTIFKTLEDQSKNKTLAKP